MDPIMLLAYAFKQTMERKKYPPRQTTRREDIGCAVLFILGGILFFMITPVGTSYKIHFGYCLLAISLFFFCFLLDV